MGEPEGEPEPLGGGITNRNYRARLGGTDYVIRVPGKDTNLLEIDRGAERIANERAARVGIAPPVAAMLADPQAIVTVFVEGEGMEPSDLREPAALTQVARSLRAIHELGEALPTEFDSFRIVQTYAETATGRGATLPGAYAEAHARAGEIEGALSGAEHDPVPCHNDLLAANFIRGDKQLWLVDWVVLLIGDVATWPWAAATLLVTVLFGQVQTMLALLIQETAFHGYSRRDLTRMLGWGLLECLWYHPLLAVWRTSGTIRLAIGRRPGWGEIPREALDEAPPASLTPLTR